MTYYNISDNLKTDVPCWKYDYGAKTKKPFILIRLLSWLLPWRGDSLFEVLRKFIFIAASVVLVVCVIYFGSYFHDMWVNSQNAAVMRDLRGRYVVEPDAPTPPSMWETLRERNPNVIGWMRIPGTQTDNVVLQTDDNDFYLHRTIDGESNRAGELFVDYNNVITDGYQSQNVTIYGHNMRNGSMFGGLRYMYPTNNRNFVEFIRENNLIHFDTVYGDAIYKIFAVMIVNVFPAQDNGNEPFNYRIQSFADQPSFLEWVNQVRRRSFIDSPVDVQEYDRIINLSTCAYDFHEARLVVFARQVREGESVEVDSAAITRNNQVLLPAAWYARHGGRPPVFEDDAYRTDIAHVPYPEPEDPYYDPYHDPYHDPDYDPYYYYHYDPHYDHHHDDHYYDPYYDQHHYHHYYPPEAVDHALELPPGEHFDGHVE